MIRSHVQSEACQHKLRHDTLHERQCPCRSPDAACSWELAFRQRVKELSCLYGITRLIEQHHNRLVPILQGVVDLLPPSWQYPETCRARLTLYDQIYQTEGFQESVWGQRATIAVNGEKVGQIEVCYLEERPQQVEGPFLQEERALIDAVAERVGKIATRVKLEEQSRVDQSALQEANAALRQVLARIEEEKAEIYRSIQANMEMIVLPTLRTLESKLPPHERHHAALIQDQLGQITSTFVNKVSRSFDCLTPAEIEVCHLIRSGMSTKDIARARHVAPATISKQRARIRRKLGIAQSEKNLMSFLLTLDSE